MSNGKEARDFTADRAICDAATGGSWDWYDRDYYVAIGRDGAETHENTVVDDTGVIRRNDSRFIAEARTGWPAALDRITELEAELHVTMMELGTEINDFDRMQAEAQRLQREIQRYRQALESIVRRSEHFVSSTVAKELRKIAKEALGDAETTRI